MKTNTFVVDTSRSPHARLRPVPIASVTLTDAFYQPRRAINQSATLPSQFEHLEQTGRLDNFRRASGKKTDLLFQGIYFNDSDVYKWLEAAASALAAGDDPALRALIQTTVAEIEAAQEPDGYLDTYFTFDRAGERFSNLRDMHELYCAGHFLQAAVAHVRATGDERLLGVARRLADHIGSVFGEGEGQKRLTDGHEEIEMALVELFRETGERRYLDLAGFFVDVRGQKTIGGSAYHQDHVAFRELGDVTGHAVRMMYLCCGAADLFLETGDETLLAALQAQWANMTTRRMYVSGGLGARYEGEAFGRDYELPNARAYAETCAAIGSVMWNHRMLLATGKARYADLLEHTLINAVLPGLSLDGQSYFYQNPLEDDGAHRRQPWFGCACCPPNVARLLAQLPGYVYGTSDANDVYVHLYVEGRAQIALPGGGGQITLRQRTNYPWDGDVHLEVESVEGGAREFGLMLRLPGWCAPKERITFRLNGGAPFDDPFMDNGYADLRRVWKTGDTVDLRLPMPVRRVQCHPYVAENAGRIALQRGPVLYCVEQADHETAVGDLRDLVLPADAQITAEHRPDLLGGVTVLTGEAVVDPAGGAHGWNDKTLYQTAPGKSPATGAATEQRVPFTAVPYYAWANRAPGRMQVWLQSR